MVRVIDPHNGEAIEIPVEFKETGKERIERDTSNGDKIFLEVIYGIVPNEPMYQDRDWLLAEYSDKARTMADIANQFDVTPMTIYGWLKKHSIPTRSRGRRGL